MKVFLIDKGLTLLAGSFFIAVIPFLFGPVTTTVLELLTAAIWIYLCKQLFLYPFDLLVGKKTKKCFFHSCISVDRYEFFRKRGFCKLRFISENSKIDLTVPLTCLIEQIDTEEMPPQNILLKVSYYPLSKVLSSWESE